MRRTTTCRSDRKPAPAFSTLSRAIGVTADLSIEEGARQKRIFDALVREYLGNGTG